MPSTRAGGGAALDAEAPAGAPAPRSLLARNASLVAACTAASRVLGFARDSALSALFGSEPVGQALRLAFNVPNFLRRLLGEGALTAVLLPMLGRAKAEKGGGEARRLVAVVGGAQAAVLVALALAGVAACLAVPPSAVARFLEDDPQRAPLLLRYLAILIPYLVPVCLYALAMAVLNAQGRFFRPAIAPFLQNFIALVACGVAWGVAARFGNPLAMDEASMDLGARIVAVGFLAGGVAMFALQLPGLRAERMLVRPRLAPRDPAFREFLSKLAPMLLSTGVVQFSVLISSAIAFAVSSGANVHLDFAARLFQLPQGLIGTAVAVAAFPQLARSWHEKKLDEARGAIDHGLALATLFGAPAAAGLLALALPIVTLLFGHGRFTAEDCEQTAWALVAFAGSIPFLTAVPLLVRVFYVAGDTRTPSAIAAGLVAIDVGLAYALGRKLGAPGIAAATTVTAVLNCALLVAFGRRFALPRSPDLPGKLVRILVVAAATGLTAYAVRAAFDAWGAGRPSGAGTARLALEVAASILAGMGAFLLVARALKIQELDDFALLRRRRR